jgi:RHS repeat-associated protein
LIGGPLDGISTSAGAAWVFVRSKEGKWSQSGSKLTGEEEIGGGHFGISVALSAEGNVALIGGQIDNSNTGAAWLFEHTGSTWGQKGAKLTGGEEEGYEGQFGISVAVSAFADTGLIGGWTEGINKGAAWMFSGDAATPEELFGLENEAEKNLHRPCAGDPVNCATGNQVETQTDLAIGGRGPGLQLTRTYNSQLAAKQTEEGRFGFGWTGPYSAHLSTSKACLSIYCPEDAMIYQDNGSTVAFRRFEGEEWESDPWVQAKLSEEGSTYVYTLPDQHKLKFNSAGRLISETDGNGNSLTMSYDPEEEELLESVADGAGRKLTFNYNEEGFVESVKDPMGHTVKYTYESDNLKSVTEPGESSPRWQFEYDPSHQMTSETDGRGHLVTMEYDGDHRVISQTDAMKRKHQWKYGDGMTTITEPNGSTMVELFDEAELPTKITHAWGTSLEATTKYGYNDSLDLVAVTDPNKHTTTYAYDSTGDRTSATDANGNKTDWTYNSAHEVETIATPKGERTTIKRDSHGNPLVIERAAPGGATQKTSYKYDGQGDLIGETDPLGRSRTYEYDAMGDRESEIDPEGDKRTWEYNEDSQEIATVSPRGNVAGGEPKRHKTTLERDAQGRVLSVTEPEIGGATRPVNATAPAISGAAVEGQTLTAGTGLWEGAPSLSYSYQWQACNTLGEECFNVPGATESKLPLSSEGVGYTLRVAVTATNSLGSATSTSQATAVVSTTAPPVYTSAFGSGGSGSGQFAHPAGVAVDSHGDVWVADSFNSRIEKFSSSGTWLASYGGFGSGELGFEEPVGVAINQSTGNVYIADQNNNRVDELNEKGEWVRSWEGGEGHFDEPDGIAVDSTGDVWVTDYANDRVEKFNEKGEFLLKFGSAGTENGKFLGPAGVVVANGYVYVTDLNNARLQAFTEAGVYVGQIGGWGIGIGGFMYPAGIAASPAGNVYVDDLGNDRIQEFTQYGSFLASFGTAGSGPGQFSEPEDIAIGSSGEIYVTDSGDNRVEKWLPAGAPSNTAPSSISGQLLIGQTLTAGTGAWAAAPSPSYAYQWERCNYTGGSCSNISGATGATYVLTDMDINKTLRVDVTATNTAGKAASTSPATEAVTGSPETQHTYDGNGDLETSTDSDGNKTTYTYDADNEPIKVEEPNGTTTETGYDSTGQVISQTDGNKHTTKYVRNLLEQIVEEANALGRATTKGYDPAGNLTKLTDPERRTTTYTYDPGNRLTDISYSDGKTPQVKYEYDEDNNRTGMWDGTGKSTYTYDQLDRLTHLVNGHGESIGFEYDLDNEQTKLTYPNKNIVTRGYDADGRLQTVTDWLGHQTKLTYDPDSNLTATTFPAETNNQDKYSYNEADQMSEVAMAKGTETLASLIYARDNDGQLKRATSKGLPGEGTTAYAYDEDNRLTDAGGTAYEYDAANSPTKIGANTYAYDDANELEKTGTGTTYAYNEAGQRIKATPSGSATTYGYNQAGDLTSVERPAEGKIPAISDTYAYDGNGLRASQTISGSTTYMAWDPIENLPLLLSDGTNSYIYGPESLPIEQINNSQGKVLYLHHDQQGSTRMLTGSTGANEAAMTYDGYGNTTATTGAATTSLGYDGQYTNADTGLIYLRARTYDPATAQFLSVDPAASLTRALYSYANDNPLNESDPTGLGNWLDLGIPSPEEFLEELNPIKYYEEEIEDYESGCSYWESVEHGLEGAAIASTDLLGVEGEDAADIIFGHGARHIVSTGLNADIVESAIRSQIEQAISHASATGTFWGRVVIDGKTIEYRAYTLPNGAINVGTYYAPR